MTGQSDRLNICFCFTDESGEYYKNPLTAMSSIFENTRDPVRVHLICDETVDPEHRDIFTVLGGRYGQEIIFYHIPPVPQAVLGNTRSIFGKGTLFRLFIPELIHEERVLYLDCDVICTMDVRAVFDLPTGSVPMAGAPDTGLRGDRKLSLYLRSLGLDPKSYVNAGVLLMDLEKIRHGYAELKDRTLSFIAEKRGLRSPDQDALNKYFQSRNINICVLPENCNYLLGNGDNAYRTLPEYTGKILHYTGEKPWKTLYPAALVYWKYYARVFSCDDVFSAIEKLSMPEYAYLQSFVLQKPKVRRWLNRVYEISEYG
ncbi:MAG: glycosyltransferase family 8 protein, partial [Desulfovibrio sp.]|nr:glycosyltransferase family 8 protein [Desulfovibrio sp.]